MSNLNKKIRKVQKGGAWSTFTGGIGTTADRISGGLGAFSLAKKELGAAVTKGDIGDKLKSLAEVEQTEEKLNSLKSSMLADETVWDMLWEEPCYIDPGSGHIVISKIRSLWCTFQSQDLKDLLNPPTKTENTIADINKCKEEFFKNKFGKSSDDIKEDITAHRQFNTIIEKIRNKKWGTDPAATPPPRTIKQRWKL